jgi:hypothetical protein
MAGANYLLDKGFTALSTYASSDVLGVQAFRLVKITAQDQIDRQTLASLITVGVVQEDVDQSKVLLGKAVVDVRIAGISKVVAGAAITIGVEVMSDTTGRVITAVTAANRVVGLALQAAAAAGDIIDVWLTVPGRVI